MYPFIIRKEKYFNFTYASIRFGPFGPQTDFPIIVCDTWKEGFEQAKKQNYKYAVFCNSGTVFNDINDFQEKIKNYPHKGLIGHIVDPLVKDEFFSLHPQCFLLELDKFSSEDFEDGEFETYGITRSDKNIHDNYTPLWICANQRIRVKTSQTKFGQKLIAAQLNNKLIVSNWHQKLRDNKIYLYTPELYVKWMDEQQDYLNLAEKQLWITNNQPLSFTDASHLVSPASGLFWIISAITKSVEKITLVDISLPQIELARELINNWDGNNYSEFVFNFVKNKKLKHLQFDIPLSPIDQLKMQKKENFCQRVDAVFQKQLNDVNLTVEEFIKGWNKIKTSPVTLINDNIINQINSGAVKLDSNSTIWISNILDYKYTWIKSTVNDIELFNTLLANSKARVLQ